MDWLRSMLRENGNGRKLLLLGFPGKTTFLYRCLLGETLQPAIPTIGFNCETITVGSRRWTAWDVGGCDKIRPLVRHYFPGVEAVVFFVGSRSLEELRDELMVLASFVSEHGLPRVPLAVFCTQRDLPASEILPHGTVVEEVAPALDQIQDRPRVLLFGSAHTDQGHDQLFKWLDAHVGHGSEPRRLDTGGAGNPPPGAAGTTEPPPSESDALDDDAFLQGAADASLPAWDHKTHLRLAYLVLTRDGRRRAVSRVMELIKSFIDRSPLSRPGRTFHLTLTYFWIHMVHFELASYRGPLPAGAEWPTFPDLLRTAPWLLDGGLYRKYYSDDVLMRNPEARVAFVLPDKAPLPTMVPS